MVSRTLWSHLMLYRTRWWHLLPYVVGGAAVYAAAALLSGVAATGGWEGPDAWVGALGLSTAVEALIAWVCLGLTASRLGRGVAQTVMGAAACTAPLLHVPVNGYQGRAEFFVGSVVFAGLLLGVQGVLLTISGWQIRPAALRKIASELPVAHQPYDLEVAALSTRVALAAVFSLMAMAGLGLAGLAVFAGLSSTADDPSPVGSAVVLGICGAVLLVLGAVAALGFARLRGWLEGTTLNVVRPAGHRWADLAAVTTAEVSQPENGSPVLILSGQGNLRRFPLRGFGTGQLLLPPGALVRLAGALAANPSHADIAPAVTDLEVLADASVGHKEPSRS
ncbi:MAG TPA: hypothetical protein VGH27_20515 [Streptosporangiaceae bacterium]|jgi:hypothetical protein